MIRNRMRIIWEDVLYEQLIFQIYIANAALEYYSITRVICTTLLPILRYFIVQDIYFGQLCKWTFVFLFGALMEWSLMKLVPQLSKTLEWWILFTIVIILTRVMSAFLMLPTYGVYWCLSDLKDLIVAIFHFNMNLEDVLVVQFWFIAVVVTEIWTIYYGYVVANLVEWTSAVRRRAPIYVVF